MPGQISQRLTVRAGAARVAMAASSVAEVIRAPRITRLPNGPPGLLGVMHLRGVILPVLSLSRLLGDEGSSTTADRVVVLRRDPPLGLAVDGVEALRAVATDGAEPEDGRLLLDQADGATWLDLGAALRERFTSAFRAATQPVLPRAPGAAKLEQALARLDFLGFTLAEQDYALPLDAVAEVLGLPPSIAALPQNDAVLLGVFTLRDAVLPAISLRMLLGLPARPPCATDQLVVARIAGQRLAFVVDRISAILRVTPDRLGPAPSLFNKGGGEARIDQVLRQPDGRGVVAILSPARVLADARLAKWLAETQDSKDADMDGKMAAGAVARERFVVIRLGTESYGLPIAAVDEVLRLPETLTRLPKAPAYMRGVISLRGRVIPVIDQRRRFAVEGEIATGGRIVVLTMGSLQAGFAVDAVSEILEVEASELLPAPAVSEDGARLFDRAAAVQRDGRVILLINPAALLDLAEADLLRDLTAAAATP